MSAAVNERMMEMEFPADPRIVHEVRQRLEEFLRPCQIGREDVEAVKVALSEACTNAVIHGSPHGAANRVRLRYAIERDRLVVEVSDEGPGFEPDEIELPDPDEWKPSGRGVVLINLLMDDVEYETLPGGTRVRLIKHLPTRSPSTGGGGIARRPAPDPIGSPSAYAMAFQVPGYQDKA